MSVGPIQIFYFKFDSPDKLQGQIRTALTDLRGKGLIRLIDVYAVSKGTDGTVNRESATDLSVEGTQRFGTAIKKAMGLDTPDAMTGEEALDLVGESLGLSATDISKLEAEIQPGEAGLVLMFEHTWAIPLREAVKAGGGRTVMQAFLSPGAAAMVGGEVNAILKAQEAVEEAEKLRNAARLDALVSLAGAQQIAQLAAARAGEAVAAAELIEESAAEDVADTLAAAEMVKEAALQDAIGTAVEAEAIKDAAVTDAVDTVVAADLIKQAAVADTLRVLYQAGQIEDAAMSDAIAALAVAGMLEAEAQQRAEDAAASAAS